MATKTRRQTPNMKEDVVVAPTAITHPVSTIIVPWFTLYYEHWITKHLANGLTEHDAQRRARQNCVDYAFAMIDVAEEEAKK